MSTLEEKKHSKFKNKFKEILSKYLESLFDDKISINLELITKEDINDESNRELIKFLCKEAKELNENQLNEIDSKYRRFNHQEDKLDINSVEYLNFFTLKSSQKNIVGYLSIQGLEQNTIEVFEQYEKCSFLKYVLDRLFEECRYIDEKICYLCDEKICNLCDDIIHKEKDYLRSLTKDFSQEIFKSIASSKKGISDLFDKLNYISALKYEGESVSAKLLLMNKDKHSENVKFHIQFDEEIEFADERKIRKILETSDENVYLIGDQNNIYGLGTLENMSIIKNEENNILVIDFYDRFEYKIKLGKVESKRITVDGNKPYEQINLYMKERNILNVVYGQPILREGEFSKEDLREKLEEVFGDVGYSKDKLLKIISYAKEQKHGTTVVITTSELAEIEIEKLKNQSTKIKKKFLIEKDEDLSKKIIESITSIDGAIIIDTKGVCYGMGVILDGLAVEEKGKSSRGARYNSAIRYANKGDLNGKCLVVVISEDGMIDIIYKDEREREKKVNNLINEIKQLYEGKKYSDALKIVEDALSLDKKNAKLYHIKGAIYSKNGQIQDAIKNYTQAIELKPNAAAIYYNRGILNKKNDEYDKAIEDFTKAIELKPDYSKAYNNRGVLYSDNEEYDKALEDYTKAIELKPDYSKAYNNRGILYDDNEEYDKALEDYNKAIGLKPDYADAYNNRGVTYKHNNEYEESVENYIKAIKLNPNFILAYKNLNITYKRLIKLYPEKNENLSKKIRKNEEIIKRLEKDEEIKKI
ncbi:tetratricopeptide repeat protein [Oceanirhabdus seepicola]|uniref:Tetratricopeptide repeat protein n=1 Tax=Oceanirhabdus seepicola TaxID=2828781 RepID=A0A9J6NXD6_9CLOT|nr:tetratricopeptide repeat protein [Oceanirhabdus seepicola]MCM1988724.1 tetratricopeptide repeat protein [Oceanirhabdus seepicola]